MWQNYNFETINSLKCCGGYCHTGLNNNIFNVVTCKTISLECNKLTD